MHRAVLVFEILRRFDGVNLFRILNKLEEEVLLAMFNVNALLIGVVVAIDIQKVHIKLNTAIFAQNKSNMVPVSCDRVQTCR